MKTAVQRWGNSLALRIPKNYADETQITEGSRVELTLKSGALIIHPVVRKQHALADLLKQITKSNRHDAVSTGARVGREAW